MEEDLEHAIALMRYSIIVPLVNRTTEAKSKDEFFRQAAQKEYLYPDGTDEGKPRRFSASVIEKWYRAYMHGKFDALLPKARSDSGDFRAISPEVQLKILDYRAKFPRLSSAGIYRKLVENEVIHVDDVSYSTINRYVNSLKEKADSTADKDMRRYELEHANDCWYGDSTTIGYIKTDDGLNHCVHAIVLIDDASRISPAVGLFFNDNYINLMSVMKSGIARYGVPKVFCFDNGKPYKNIQMYLLAARLGCQLRYCRPYSPEEKGKIERFVGTLKTEWLDSIDLRDFHSLKSLDDSVQVWRNHYVNSPHSSLDMNTPMSRFLEDVDRIKRIIPEELDNTFLLEVERKVSKDRVAVIDNVQFELPIRFAMKKVRMRYTPNMEQVYVVENDNSLTLVPRLDKHVNAVAKRDKIRLRPDEGGTEKSEND